MHLFEIIVGPAQKKSATKIKWVSLPLKTQYKLIWQKGETVKFSWTYTIQNSHQNRVLILTMITRKDIRYCICSYYSRLTEYYWNFFISIQTDKKNYLTFMHQNLLQFFFSIETASWTLKPVVATNDNGSLQWRFHFTIIPKILESWNVILNSIEYQKL